MVRPVRPVRWLDKGLKRRHASSAKLDNLVVLAPHPDWVATLPHGKLPDRQRFKRWRHDRPARIAAWTHAVAAAQQLAEQVSRLAGHADARRTTALGVFCEKAGAATIWLRLQSTRARRARRL